MPISSTLPTGKQPSCQNRMNFDPFLANPGIRNEISNICNAKSSSQNILLMPIFLKLVSFAASCFYAWEQLSMPVAPIVLLPEVFFH